MERSENGTITVHVRNTQIGEDGISGLLKLISPDCCRDDWLRVGSFLKHQTMCDGWPLWRDWSQRSEQCSPKLLYEWKNLGSGNECTLGTLIYLALQSTAADVCAMEPALHHPRLAVSDQPKAAVQSR